MRLDGGPTGRADADFGNGGGEGVGTALTDAHFGFFAFGYCHFCYSESVRGLVCQGLPNGYRG